MADYKECNGETVWTSVVSLHLPNQLVSYLLKGMLIIIFDLKGDIMRRFFVGRAIGTIIVFSERKMGKNIDDIG